MIKRRTRRRKRERERERERVRKSSHGQIKVPSSEIQDATANRESVKSLQVFN